MGYNPIKQTWLNPHIEYLFNTEIIEYDIVDAGFSLIKQYNLLSAEQIRWLESLDKGLERHIAIGKIQRDDKVFSTKLTQKFAEIRAIFLAANNINVENDMISVKKDAIFTIGRCNKTQFDGIAFKQKNTYTSYIRFPEINNMEIYYSSEQTDIKGMGESAVNRHRLYMLDFLNHLIPMIESHNSRAKRYLIKFIDDYKHMNLDEEYYYEFNNKSSDFNPQFNFQNVLLPLALIVLKELD